MIDPTAPWIASLLLVLVALAVGVEVGCHLERRRIGRLLRASASSPHDASRGRNVERGNSRFIPTGDFLPDENFIPIGEVKAIEIRPAATIPKNGTPEPVLLGHESTKELFSRVPAPAGKVTR